MSRYKLSILAGITFIFLGVVSMSIPLLNNKLSDKQSSFNKVEAASTLIKPKVKISGKPLNISIPSLSINLDIIDGIYYPKNQSWTLSLDKAQYAIVTPEPNNQEGNTFIYAHNRKGVFADLPKVSKGNTVKINTSSGNTFIYKYRETVTTSANDTSLFYYHGSPILTLQTCTGSWYQNRSLYIFDFVGVE